jgi:hypothetical protein
VFAPGNTVDRSNPFAPDDSMVAALTGPSGSVPACFRAMDTLGSSSGGWQNWVSATDLPPTDTFSYNLSYAGNPPIGGVPFTGANTTPSGVAIFQFARFLNTNPANTTYSWSSPKLYSTDAWANSGTDSFGNYLDLTAGPNGAADNGSFLLDGPEPNSGIVELRSTSPHGIKSRMFVNLFADPQGSAMIPWTSFGAIDFPASAYLPVYVTGPNTIACTFGLGSGGAGSVTQTVNSTTEVPVSIGCFIQVPTGPTTCPFQLVAGAAAAFPGSAMWLNLPQIGDDSIYTEIANRVASSIGPTNDVVLEMGNEHWNSAPAFHEWPNEMQAKNLGKYMPPGQTLWTYFPTRGGPIADDGTNDLFYTVKANHSYDVFTARWVALGLDPARLKRMIGSQWTSSGSVKKICGYLATYSIPAPFGICVAPYQPLSGRDNNFTPIAAFTTAGYPGYAGGNWPVDAINDYFRHQFMYNSDNWNVWADQFPSLPSGTRMCAYESGIDYSMPDQLPFTYILGEDCFTHPSYYDVLHGYELMIQQGSPLVPNSGVVLQSYFNLWNDQSAGMPLWHLGLGFSQPAGHGLSNSFLTPQGGLGQPDSGTGVWPAGYGLINQSPGYQLLRDWNAATSGGGGATGYVFSGPSSGFVGVPVTLTVSPDATVTDTVTLSDGGAGGTFSPSATATFAASAATQHPTYTPSAAGAKTITATSAAGGVVSGSPISLSVSAISYTLSGASSGFDGVPITLTVTPSGIATDTITLSDGGSGLFLPSATLTFSGSSSPQSPTYTPGSTGTKSVTATSAAGGAVAGSPLSISVTARGYTVTGASTGFVGNSITYTVTPSGTTTDTMTFSDASGGGSFSPTSLSWSVTSNAQVVHYTPGSTGTKTLTFTSADGGTVIGSPFSLVVSRVGFTLSGPTSGATGTALTYTVTPAASVTDTITVAHSGSTGTLSTTTLTFTASASPQTFTFTPSAAGTATITATSSAGGTVTGSPITATISVVTHAKAKKFIVGKTRTRIR